MNYTFPIGSVLWYYCGGQFKEKNRPRAAMIVAPGVDPDCFDLVVFTAKGVVGMPPMVFRDNVPFKEAFPVDGTFPTDQFCTNVGVMFNVPIIRRPESIKEISEVVVPAISEVVKPNKDAPINRLMQHPAWARNFEQDFDGSYVVADGMLQVKNKAGAIVAAIDFTDGGYRMLAPDGTPLTKPDNSPRGIASVLTKAAASCGRALTGTAATAKV